jgi:RNA polymerase sigma factor (sigma-70 family)
VPEEDLIQEGYLGLIKAVDRYDPAGHGNRFSAYATFWIRAFMQRALDNNATIIRFPKHTQTLRKRLRRSLRDVHRRRSMENGDVDPAGLSVDGVLKSSGVTHRQLRRMGLRECEITLLEDLVDEPATDQLPSDRDLLRYEDLVALYSAIARLAPFEAWVIGERFGLDLEWVTGPMLPSSRRASRRPPPERPAPGDALHNRCERQSQSYYHRTLIDLSEECGLSLFRLRAIEKYTLDKLRGYLGAGFFDATSW